MSDDQPSQAAPQAPHPSSAAGPDAPTGRVAVGHPVDVASGNLFQEETDHALEGRMALLLKRRYSGKLVTRTAGMFGSGWSSPFEMRLTSDLDGYRMVDEDGETEVLLNDPDGRLSRGEVLQNLNLNAELRRDGGWLVVTRWDHDTHEVTHLRFLEGVDGQWWPLRSIERPDAQGLDLRWNDQGQLISVVQRREKRGYQFVYQQGRVQEVWLQVGAQRRQVMRYGYSPEGRLIEATDALSRSFRYEYDAQGRLSRDIPPGGMIYTFRYDRQGRCTQTTGLEGFGCHTLEYLSGLRATRVTNALGAETLYEYNESGQIEREISSLGRISSTVYDAEGRIQSRISPSGAKTQYTYDGAGNRCAIQQADGSVIQFEHDLFHQLIAVTDPSGARWHRQYDAQNRLASVTDPLGASVHLRYGEADDLVGLQDAVGNVRHFQYNAHGDLIASTDWMGHITRYEWSSEGRLTALINALGQRTEVTLDEEGRVRTLQHSDGKIRRYGWDVHDQLSEVIDELGAVQRYRYSPCGYLVESLRPDGSIVRFEWGLIPKQLLAVYNEKGEAHRFEYDGDGRLAKEVDFAGRETRYTYDDDGQVSEVLNAAGERTSVARDPLGRITEVHFPDGTQSTLEYDPRGLLVKADNGQSVLTRAYDACGRKLTEAQGDFQLSHQYDAMGFRIGRHSNLGGSTGFSRDPNGQCVRMQPDGARALLFEYSALGQTLSRRFEGGVGLEERFDGRGRLLEQWWRPATLGTLPSPGSAAPWQNPEGITSYASVLGMEPVRIGLSERNTLGRVAVGGRYAPLRRFSYDPVGNLTHILDTHHGQSRYAYDALGRMVRMQDPTGRLEVFTWDKTHNLQARVQANPPGSQGAAPVHQERGARYGAGDVLEHYGHEGYAYDRLGRLLRRREADGTETHLSWNGAGQLVGVEKHAPPSTFPQNAGADAAVGPVLERWLYRYDVLGRRIEKVGPGVRIRYDWDGDVLLHERVQVGEGASRRIDWEFEESNFAPLWRREETLEALCVCEPNGAPREWVSPEGYLLWQARYDGLGKVEGLEAAPGFECHVRLQGQWADAESGLHYNRFRYYDSNTGRFVSPDPIGLLGGFNLYAFAPNTTGWVDPWGLASVYLRNNESYVGKAKYDANTRYGKKDYATDIITDIPDTDTAQGVEQIVYERMKKMEEAGSLDSLTNKNRPVNMSDPNKVYRRDMGEAFLKKKYGDNYLDEIDKLVKKHYDKDSGC